MGLQRRSLATLDNANGQLRQQLAAARGAAPGDGPSRAASAASDKTAPDQGPINWKMLAGQLEDMQRSGVNGDMRTMLRLQQRVQAMTQQELLTALDEIAALGLPAAACAMLEQMLIRPLILQDPELALTRFSERLKDATGLVCWQLADALREWAKKDAGKASTWFDQQIAAGNFDSKSLDGKSQSRMHFEGVLINVLLAADFPAADLRLGALPEDQRSEVMRNNLSFGSVKEDDHLAVAKLIRARVPASEQGDLFAQQASRLVQVGYAEVTDYLSRIEATPAERTACVEHAASSKLSSNNQQVTREDLDAMRAWADTQAPAATGHLTGNILANATQGIHPLGFAEAGELALQYGQASGNDEVLGTFLESWTARANKEAARALAAKISDEERRAAILKNLH
ncbi:MAG: hypothetical protein NTW21_32375 [Verrucomicrobia bacterium]|nr:hypothetical protein [Verrucomicrobiota bacterium]